MATLSPPDSAASGFDAFRAALPAGAQAGPVAHRLCAIGAALELARGETLATTPAEDQLVFIVSGAAKLLAPPPCGCPAAAPAQVLAFHFAGDLVPVLRRVDADFRLVALVDCELTIFPSERFLDIAQADPAVLRTVLARALQALHTSRTRMIEMGRKSAGARLADFLVAMAERLAGCTHGPCSFALPMSRAARQSSRADRQKLTPI